MIRIAALNRSEDEVTSAEDAKAPATASTKEYQEANALALYNQALTLQRAGENGEAEVVLRKLLACEYVSEVASASRHEGNDANRSMLKYSAYKNLANIAAQKQDHHGAIVAILEAVKIDGTDVTMWYKLGKHARSIDQLPLARLAFEEGLNCNPNHWPCLDNLVTILYVLTDYMNCLYFIGKALEKDSAYAKGIVFRRKMFKEEPPLRDLSAAYFEYCDPEIDHLKVDSTDEEEFIKEAMYLRGKHMECRGNKCTKLPRVMIPGPLQMTWLGLGSALIRLYEHVIDGMSELSLGCYVDLSPHLKNDLVSQNGMTVGTMSSAKSSSDVSCATARADPSAATHPVPMEVVEDDAINNAPSEDHGQLPGVQSENPDLELCSNAPSIEPENVVNSVHQLPSVSASVTAPAATSGGGQNDTSKKVQKRKKTAPVICLDDLGIKRRSARVHVRNTTHSKKDEGKVDYHAILSRLLPPSLNNEDVSHHQEIFGLGSSQLQNSTKKKLAADVFGCGEQKLSSGEEEEKCEVEQFLAKWHNNTSVLGLMEKYLFHLAGKQHLVWPRGLAEVFVSVFEKQRQHFDYTGYTTNEASPDYLRYLADVGLLIVEFAVDRLGSAAALGKSRASHGATKNSPRKSQHSAAGSQGFGAAACHGCTFSDFYWLRRVSTFPKVMTDAEATIHRLRLFWAEGHLTLLQGMQNEAASCFSQVKDILEDCDTCPTIQIVNCRNHNAISQSLVESQLQAMQRSRSLEEVQQLYDDKEYDKVVELLLPTCAHVSAVSGDTGDTAAIQQLVTTERHRQLLLLQDSLMQLKDYTRAALSTEASIYESLLHCQHAVTGPAREEWAKTTCELMKGMIRCLADGVRADFVGGQSYCPAGFAAYSSLSAKARSRLARSAIHAAVAILEAAGDGSCDMPRDVSTPWILLHHVVKLEEDRLSLDLNDDSNPEVVPASLVLLSVAHEYLGRRAWCVASDGELLLFSLDVFVRELGKRRSSDIRSMLERNVEQCFFCLYSHPNKRAKARHLEDHSCSAQVSLTWKRAIALFEYFKPETLPSFDSYKSCAVSPEIENLLGRIASLVPALLRPPQKAEESVMAFIDGSSLSLSVRWPERSLSSSRGCAVVKDLFYLLADYYFKNKEPLKAVRYYIMDICVNPERFDSWAGMALARCSKLESRLSSVEKQGYEGGLIKLAEQTLRCFEEAIKIDGSNGKLWIEYGSTAYHLASFASRLLKQTAVLHTEVSQRKTPGARSSSKGINSEEDCDTVEGASKSSLRKLRSESLALARRCYAEAAKRCEDADDYSEEWLHHYMLGKVAEKLGEGGSHDGASDKQGKPSPACTAAQRQQRREACRQYLEHYRLAAHFLHEDGAPYPKKINFVYSAPTLAIESLEMYYRLHASILKYLEQDCTVQDYIILKQHVDEAQRSPFTMTSETKRGRKSLSIDSMSSAVQEKKSAALAAASSSAMASAQGLPSLYATVSESAAASRVLSTLADDVAAAMDHILEVVACDTDKEGRRAAGPVNDQVLSLLPGGTAPSIAVMETEDILGFARRECELDGMDVQTASGDAPLASGVTSAPIQEEEEPAEEAAMTESQKQELIEQCLKALRLCASRYPLHYKSYYRIARTYLLYDCVKDTHLAREVLLGTVDTAATVCGATTVPASAGAPAIQGLFQERKPNNFFNGVWRIPVAEIERPGSFAAHLCRTTELVLYVLESENDADLLFQLHIQLVRVPDSGKKFLRDTDRLRLAALAYSKALNAYEKILRDDSTLASAASSVDARSLAAASIKLQPWLVNVYRLWCYGVKHSYLADEVNHVLLAAFKAFQRCAEEAPSGDQLDDAIVFCQQLIAANGRQTVTPLPPSLCLRAPAHDKGTKAAAPKCSAAAPAVIAADAELLEAVSAVPMVMAADESATLIGPSDDALLPVESTCRAVAAAASSCEATAHASETGGSPVRDAKDGSRLNTLEMRPAEVAAQSACPCGVVEDGPRTSPAELPSCSPVQPLSPVCTTVIVPQGSVMTATRESSALPPTSQVTIAADLPSLTYDDASSVAGDTADTAEDSSRTTLSSGYDIALVDMLSSEDSISVSRRDERSILGEHPQVNAPADDGAAQRQISEGALFGYVSTTEDETALSSSGTSGECSSSTRCSSSSMYTGDETNDTGDDDSPGVASFNV